MEFLWIYRENPEKKDIAESMLTDKLILNSKVLNSSLEAISILKFTGNERFHFLKKNFSLKKIVLFGVMPQQFGIQLQLPEYQIIKHLDYYFLWVNAPEDLPSIPGDKKVLLAQKLTQLGSL